MRYDAYGRLTTRTTRVPAHEPRRAADRARRSSERIALARAAHPTASSRLGHRLHPGSAAAAATQRAEVVA